MNARDTAINIVNMMTDNQVESFVNLFKPVVSEISTEETMNAMIEAEEMLKSTNAKKFYSVKELFEDLQS